MWWYLDNRPKSGNGPVNNENDDGVNGPVKPGSSSTSCRKRSFSSEAKNEEEQSSENDSTANKKTLSNETSFEVSDDSHLKSPASKKPKVEDNPGTSSYFNTNSEENHIGNTRLID